MGFSESRVNAGFSVSRFDIQCQQLNVGFRFNVGISTSRFNIGFCVSKVNLDFSVSSVSLCFVPIIQSCRLTLFGHIIRMDDNADAKRMLLASPPADWRKQLGRPRITWLGTIQQDLKQHHLTLPEALKQHFWLRIALCGG